MTSSSQSSIDTEDNAIQGSNKQYINFEIIQKINVSGEYPSSRQVTKPIEIQKFNKCDTFLNKKHSIPIPKRTNMPKQNRHLLINYNDLDELFKKLILSSKAASQKIGKDMRAYFENPFRGVYTFLSVNNKNNNSNRGPFSVSTPKIKFKKFLGIKTKRNKAQQDNQKSIITYPKEEEEGCNTQNSSNNSVDSYNQKCLSEIKRLLLDSDKKYETVNFKSHKNVLIDFNNFFYSFMLSKNNDKILSLMKTDKLTSSSSTTIENENEIAKEITELKCLIQKC